MDDVRGLTGVGSLVFIKKAEGLASDSENEVAI